MSYAACFCPEFSGDGVVFDLTDRAATDIRRPRTPNRDPAPMSAQLEQLAGADVKLDKLWPAHQMTVICQVLTINPTDVGPIVIDATLLLRFVEVHADSVAAVQRRGRREQVNPFAAFPALIAGKACAGIRHRLATPRDLQPALRGLR